MPPRSKRKRSSARAAAAAPRRSGVAPKEGDEIVVCFLDHNDVITWYKAGVSDITETVEDDDAVCSGTVVYAETEETPEEEEDVHFFPDKTLRKRDYVGPPDGGFCMWKHPSRRKVRRVGTGAASPTSYASPHGRGGPPAQASRAAPSTPSAKRKFGLPKRSGNARRTSVMLSGDATHASSRARGKTATTGEGMSSRPTARSTRKPTHTSAAGVDVDLGHAARPPRHPFARSLEDRVTDFEAELRVMRRRNLTELELKVLREVRVDAKLGVISALQRKLTHIQAGEDAPQHEAVLQPGCLKWSYNVAMDRFQLFVVAVHKHFCHSPSIASPRSVIFYPAFELLDSEEGFSRVEIHFKSVMELFAFLGIRTTSTITKLMWTPYEARGANHLRVLGGVQTECSIDKQSLNLTVGYSCTEQAVDTAGSSARVHADSDAGAAAAAGSARETDNPMAPCFRIENASWDNENGRFANEPQLVQVKSGFRCTQDYGEASFSVTWTSETPRTQRLLDPDAVDREGVRRGTMVVQLPYYIVGPELTSQLKAGCDRTTLQDIIKNVL